MENAKPGVGKRFAHTLDKNWIIEVIRWELNPFNMQLERKYVKNCHIHMYIYTYIYMYGTMVATSCDLNAPRCTAKVPQIRLHGSRGGVFVDHQPRRDPGDPLPF